MTGKIRIVLADDHYLVREGVRHALASNPHLEVVAAVGTADELELVVDREHPEAVITDIRMPPDHRTEGIDAALRIRARHPRVGIVVLSQYNDPGYAMDLLRDGTTGMAYLLKERIGDPLALTGAVEAVVEGGSRIDPAVVSALVTASRYSSPLAALTDRERVVLELMAQGLTNGGIAAHLHLSESSIEKYAGSLFGKLGLGEEPHQHRRVAAVLTHLEEQGRARPLRDG